MQNIVGRAPDAFIHACFGIGRLIDGIYFSQTIRHRLSVGNANALTPRTTLLVCGGNPPFENISIPGNIQPALANIPGPANRNVHTNNGPSFRVPHAFWISSLRDADGYAFVSRRSKSTDWKLE